ncbi:DUF1289 domain-containing protein [Paracoccus kondratievae]|uniref:DUF1289 domain-containing protein n=1 Tax=Paracoccus TaxID=265 RepID=UPI000225F48B|nr:MULTISPECIES: DUF1289 domain-containing protein [Paracoccus]QFQ86270.1 DUF1289 domain-containing protein [Paracoccus kondratievae]SMG13345.1 hypothetical protein SAMN02746000_00660 [Paracoccus sp. J56]
MKPSSPCIQICQIYADSGLCRGCLRSLDEIARWASMTEAERLAIMAQLPDRQLTGRRAD